MFFSSFAFFCLIFPFFLCFYKSQSLKIAHQLRCAARFGYFLFFSARGGGRGSPRRQEWGGGDRFFFNRKSQEGGYRRGRGRAAGRVELGHFFGGGGPKFSFFGAETFTKSGKTPRKAPRRFESPVPSCLNFFRGCFSQFASKLF